MRTLHTLLISLGVLWSTQVHAVLGGEGQANTTGLAVVSSTNPSYSVRTFTTEAGTTVREYLDVRQRVFAVAWEGPTMPDLRRLIGDQHFNTLVREAAKHPHAGRTQLQIKSEALVVESGGMMRAYHGSAYLPGQLPAGIQAEQIQ